MVPLALCTQKSLHNGLTLMCTQLSFSVTCRMLLGSIVDLTDKLTLSS